MRTAWINRNGDDWPEHLDSPDAVITTITELRELLEAAR
jgi:FMN phosphatase YigB (HAD superfamily)